MCVLGLRDYFIGVACLWARRNWPGLANQKRVVIEEVNEGRAGQGRASRQLTRSASSFAHSRLHFFWESLSVATRSLSNSLPTSVRNWTTC